ncbi:MAG: hypothetical protein KDB00_21475 [Planctomycetales bacterium]|nr:hypothetical protein [Planctomycetales bacterium]
MSSINSKSNDQAFPTVDDVPVPQVGATGLRAGRVVAFTPDGDILVQTNGADDSLMACDFLQSTESDCPVFRVGDEVLVHVGIPGERSCVLGLKRRYKPATSAEFQEEETNLSDHVVVEAGKSLSLRCGDTTIKITKEGKILIKGIDILARAKRSHRIKGGTVAIN